MIKNKRLIFFANFTTHTISGGDKLFIEIAKHIPKYKKHIIIL